MNPQPPPTQPAAMGPWWRKPVRTAVQIVAGLGVTWVMGQLGPHIPTQYYAPTFGIVTFVISSAQNWSEAHGLIPILLPSPAQKAAVATKA